MWRLVGRAEVGSPQPWEIYERWSFEDVLDAHIRLDLQEEVERQEEAVRKAAEAARQGTKR